MPIREIVKCNNAVAGRVKELIACYTGETPSMNDMELVCIKSSECVEILIASQKVLEIVRRLSKPAIEDYKVFTLGVHAARLCRDKLLPLLGLQALIDPQRIKQHYIVLGRHAARLFTYGRDALPEGIIEANVREECRDKPLIVLNEDREVLGYARPKRVKGGRVIFQNVLDVGWYLRSGV